MEEGRRVLERVSVVIVHYRTPDLLRACLASIASDLDAGLEVIVVDNASGDRAPDDVVAAFPSVTLVRNDENVGYSRGVNAGIHRSGREFVLVLNPDIVVEPGGVAALVSAADDHPGAGILAPKLENPDGTLQYSCRRFYDWKTFLYRRTFMGKLRPDAPVLRRHMMLDYDHADARVVDWVLGGAMLVRRAAIDDVGPMDERFFMYFEDVDWCFRMHQRGWRVVYEPRVAMVHHHRRESAKRPLGRSFQSHVMSVLRFYEKWSLILYVLKSQRAEIARAARFIVDLVALNGAFVAAFLVRKALGDVLEKPVFPVSSYRNFWMFGNVIAIGIFYVQGFYRAGLGRQDWVDRLFSVARGTGVVTLILMATTFLMQVQSYSRTMVLLFGPLATGFIWLGRQWLAGVTSKVRGRRLDLPRVAIVGPERAVESLREALDARRERDFEPLYLPGYRARASADPVPFDAEGVERFLALIRAERAGAVLFAAPAADRDPLRRLVPGLVRMGVRVQLLPEYADMLGPDARLQEISGRWGVTLGGRHKWRARGVGKRVMDLLGAAVGILALALPNALYVLVRVVTGQRPLFQREERVGYSGTRFAFWMYNPRPRGNLLSVMVLDHYPRLFAVLRGTLSLVGVYPYRPGEEPDAAGAPIDAPPGVTGLWWFHRGGRSTMEGFRAMDIEYVRRWSTTYDLKTFLRALTALVRTRGHIPEAPLAEPDPVAASIPVSPMGEERP